MYLFYLFYLYLFIRFGLTMSNTLQEIISILCHIVSIEEEDRKEYYNLSGSDQMKISVAYAGLIAALLYAMNENNKNR